MDVLDKLKGGDLRSIGRVNEVITDILRDPSSFEAVFNGMLDDDSVVRMRSADALETTQDHPEYLQPFKTKLIRHVAKSEQQEVRWHVAQMFPRLDLSRDEQEVVIEILLNYLNDKSKIVKTFSMQALADLAEADPSLKPEIIPVIEELTRTGSPAMRSRGRKLLKILR